MGAAVDSWIAAAETSGDLSDSTIVQYRFIERYVEPIKNRRIADLRVANITACVNASKKRLGEKNKKNVRMPRLVYVILRAALRAHQKLWREDLFPKRAAPSKNESTARDMSIWSAAQVRHFLSATKKDRHNLLYRFAVETGMRQGKIIALHWRDVHDGFLRVTGTYNRITREVGDTKTTRSRRAIAMSRELASALKARRGKPDLPVFPATDGKTMLDPRNLLRAFVAAQERLAEADEAAGRDPLPRLRFHDLRHCSASLLFAARTAPKIVSDRLGHSSIRVTHDVYTHMIPGFDDPAAAVLGRALSEPKSVTKSVTKRKRRAAR
ncbi:MAG: site-specific integrase [Vulcanimicrobiaceae bacterium]